MELDKVYYGDCFELMKKIPDESIDLVIADPPYGITRNSWDKAISLDDFWRAIKRICKRNAAI